MRIALILTPYYRRESPAAELGMLLGILKKEGHSVFTFDINNGIFIKYFKARRYWRFLHLDSDAVRDADFFSETRQIFDYFVSEILNSKPDVIVFYSHGNTDGNSNKMAGLLKEKSKNTPVVFTGILHRDEEEKVMHIENQDKFPQYLPQDFTIMGYDEISLPKLVSAIANNKDPLPEIDKMFERYGKIIDCSEGPFFEDLDSLPYFDFTDFDLNLYRIPSQLEIFTTRSCIWKCKFCRDWEIQGKFRSMSGKRIFNEFLHQSKLHKEVTNIRLVDLAINSNISALSEFCDLMIESRKNNMLKIYWSGDAIVHPGMTKDLLLKMKEVGCVGIGYGLESGSENVVKAIGKHFSIAIAEDVIRNTHNANIKSSVNIITGYPTETAEDFEQTVNFIKRNREYIDEIRLTFLGCQVREFSELFKDSERLKILSNSSDYWQTEGGKNTDDERYKRFGQLAALALSLNIEFRLGGRILRKAT